MDAALLPIEGLGAPICVRQAQNRKSPPGTFSASKAAIEAEDFLLFYKNEIEGLPKPEKNAALYLESLSGKEKAVFATILPLAAAIKSRNSIIGFRELIEDAKAHAIKQIDKILAE
jgi:DNA-dependent RNA polymerase auxiliary subunit epsilon